MSASVALVRRVSSVASEVRQAWALGLRISLSIGSDTRRVEGFVETVSPTDAYCVVAGLHIPLGVVMAVHRPSRLGDSTFREGREAWAGRIPPGAYRDPAQLEIPGLDV